MVVKYKAKSLFPDKYRDDTLEVEQVNTCPICKRAISPVHLNSVFWDDNNFFTWKVIYYVKDAIIALLHHIAAG